jgi:ABC-2 type transport system ATP-binding protein
LGEYERIEKKGAIVDLAIQTEHLTKIYGRQIIAVNDLNLEVPRGTIFGLLGPNGAGKTTALRLLLGLQRPTAGRCEVFGKPCGVNSIGVRRMIGHLPTNPKLPGNLRPIEYLDLLSQLFGIPSEERKPRLASLLRAVGLLGATGQKIRTFSTGMTTRLGIAASLVGDPPLLIWDEPTAGLDPSARRFTLDLIRELGKNRTVVVSSHILSDIDQVCSHVGVIHEGRMIFCGALREMKRRLRRDAFRLELDGSSEAIEQFATQASAVEGVSARVDVDETLILQLADGCSRAGCLAEVLRLVESGDMTLQSLRSSQNETEDVYLQLLQEDEAHGFHRFDLGTEIADDAVLSDTPA